MKDLSQKETIDTGLKNLIMAIALRDPTKKKFINFLCGMCGNKFIISLKASRGIAQSGSALALGASGRKFESYYPDQCACSSVG